MKNREESREFRSVDWESVSGKRDWASTAWTAAAVVIMLAGLIGGLVLRTGLTGGPDFVREPGPATHNAEPADHGS